ncbi:MAG TPA: hypothetical protein VGK20_13650 [Candidatus Binatia bacterium]|jgi:hypothetical protein
MSAGEGTLVASRVAAGGGSVEEIAAAFVALTLPKTCWTHHAHLRVGLWHVAHHGADEALALLRARIRALNESHGVANTETGGYHESITRFYVWRIATFLASADRARGLDELAADLIERFGAKDLPLQYWSRERLMSVPARLGWVEPDVTPLLWNPRS